MRTLTAILALTLLATWPADAQARGGTYRGPGGAVPPMMREPSDPTPPPPPPPISRPTIVPRKAAGPLPTPPPTPPTPPNPLPFVHPAPGQRQMLSFDNWRFWYHHNQELFEARPRAGRELAQDTAVIDAQILPTILRCCDTQHARHQAIRGAAYLALARFARDPEHVTLLRKHASVDRDLVAKESAILALGLLRRSDKARQFPAEVLDAARADLLAILGDEEGTQARARTFAAAALGLLSDQPTRSAVGAKALTVKLFGLLHGKHHHPDIALSVLLAIGLQPHDSISDEQRERVRAVLRTGTFAGRRSYQGKAHAALALGRMGVETDAALLLDALQDPTERSRNVGRSAAIALGTLAPRLSADARSRALRRMTELLDLERQEPKPDGTQHVPVRDATQRGVMLLSRARIAAVDAGMSGVAGTTARILGEESYLRTRLAEGRAGEKSYAALALAWLGRALRDSENEERKALVRRTAALLSTSLADKKLSPRTRGACAVALGLVGATGAGPALLTLLQDKKQDPSFRGACARALGLLGSADPALLRALEAVLRERRSELLLLDCSAALGMLGSPASGDALLGELKRRKSMASKGTAAAALGAIGARAQIEALAQLAADEKQQALARAMAVAALGRIADPEGMPSMARITGHLNWRALSDFLNELLSIL